MGKYGYACALAPRTGGATAAETAGGAWGGFVPETFTLQALPESLLGKQGYGAAQSGAASSDTSYSAASGASVAQPSDTSDSATSAMAAGTS